MNSDPVDIALESAPVAVRDYINNGLLDKEVVRIGQKYGLHVDLIGTLAYLTQNMLLGLSSPTEVAGELALEGVESSKVKQILAELNERIFTPIHDKVHNPTSDTENEDESFPVAEPSLPTPPQSPVEPLAPTPVVHMSPPPAVVLPPPPMAPPAPAPAPVVEQEHPSMRTMATDMQAVKEHRPIEPLFTPPPMPPAPPPVRVAPPPAPPPAPPQIATPRPAPPPPTNLPGAPVVHEYSVDPYREPIE